MHCARERERKLAEQGAREAALNTDRSVDGGEGNGHRDDGTNQFARGVYGGTHRGFTHVNVPLDVLHHNDGVVDDQSDRQHDRQQGQQVDGETRYQHQKDCADKGNRNGDDRNQNGSH